MQWSMETIPTSGRQKQEDYFKFELSWVWWCIPAAEAKTDRYL